MQQPRFVHPNFVMQRQIDRHHGPKFGPRWPRPHRNLQSNYFPRGTNNFQSDDLEYWCETCDRGFNTLQLLENHKQQHQKCNIDGCQFIAHPKVITKHIQMQHSTGLFKKIANINNPEEIKKWREERKSKYPTRENIEKKDAEIKEKVDRGEKMGMKYNRENKWHKSEHNRKRKSSNENNHNLQFKRNFQINKNSNGFRKNMKSELIKKPLLPKRDDKIMFPKDDTWTLKPFTGILHLLDDVDTENISEEPQNSYPIEDDEYIVEEPNQVKNLSTTESVVCGALSSLMCNYESSDNESIPETETRAKNPQNENKPIITEVSMRISSDYNAPKRSKKSDDDDSGPEEIKIDKDPKIENNIDLSINNSKEQKNNSIHKKIATKERNFNINKRNNAVKLKSKLPSTLLEQLLSNEIQQERNIVLQCIRYILKKNYFENNIEK